MLIKILLNGPLQSVITSQLQHVTAPTAVMGDRSCILHHSLSHLHTQCLNCRNLTTGWWRMRQKPGRFLTWSDARFHNIVYIAKIMEVRLSHYLVLVSVDSKTRQQKSRNSMTRPILNVVVMGSMSHPRWKIYDSRHVWIWKRLV